MKVERNWFHYRYLLQLLIVALVLPQQATYAVVGPIEPGQSLWCITQRIGNTTDTILDLMGNLLDCACSGSASTAACAAVPITQVAGNITLSTAGNYCLVSDFVGTIVIAGNDITLDLNNRKVMGTISITNLRNVNLFNGFIIPPATAANLDPAAVSVSSVSNLIINNCVIDCSISGPSVNIGINGRVGITFASSSGVQLLGVISLVVLAAMVFQLLVMGAALFLEIIVIPYL